MTHLLLAADPATAMRYGGALLECDDIDFEAVTTGRALLDKLNEAPNYYSIVVLDYALADPGGPECIRVIRQLHGRLPIFVLSDSNDPGHLQELAQNGIRKSSVLALPADASTFRQWIGDAIKTHIPSAPGPNGSHRS